MGTGVGITAPFGRLLRTLRHSRRVRGQFDARGRHKQAGQVHLHLAHALACLGERAEAAAEYRAALALEDRAPADVRDEARAGLAALTAGRPAPLTRFAQ